MDFGHATTTIECIGSWFSKHSENSFSTKLSDALLSMPTTNGLRQRIFHRSSVVHVHIVVSMSKCVYFDIYALHFIKSSIN